MTHAFLIDLREGERIPEGYGLSYRPWDRAITIAAPIPFNLIIGWGRRLWFALKRGNAKEFRDELVRAKQQGYDRGFADCAHGALIERRDLERQIDEAHDMILALRISHNMVTRQ